MVLFRLFSKVWRAEKPKQLKGEKSVLSDFDQFSA